MIEKQRIMPHEGSLRRDVTEGWNAADCFILVKDLDGG